jgi:hypothetical protein
MHCTKDREGRSRRRRMVVDFSNRRTYVIPTVHNVPADKVSRTNVRFTSLVRTDIHAHTDSQDGMEGYSIQSNVVCGRSSSSLIRGDSRMAVKGISRIDQGFQSDAPTTPRITMASILSWCFRLDRTQIPRRIPSLGSQKHCSTPGLFPHTVNSEAINRRTRTPCAER